MRFDIHESTDRGITTLTPDGELNETTSGVLRGRVLDIAEEGRRLVIIDLRTTSSATSHALRVLLMLSKKLQSVGGRLVICGARDDVDNALTLSGLNRLCCVTADRDQAVDQLMVENRIVRLAALVAKLLDRAEQRRASAEAV
ncbi:MAG: STAS domain-containing protein [Holophagae bacterium]|jgi:anti-anti-sigma factor